MKSSEGEGRSKAKKKAEWQSGPFCDMAGDGGEGGEAELTKVVVLSFSLSPGCRSYAALLLAAGRTVATLHVVALSMTLHSREGVERFGASVKA